MPHRQGAHAATASWCVSTWESGSTITESSDLPEKWDTWIFAQNFLDVKYSQTVLFCLPLQHEQNISAQTHIRLLACSPWVKGSLKVNPAIRIYTSEYKNNYHYKFWTEWHPSRRILEDTKEVPDWLNKMKTPPLLAHLPTLHLRRSSKIWLKQIFHKNQVNEERSFYGKVPYSTGYAVSTGC